MKIFNKDRKAIFLELQGEFRERYNVMESAVENYNSIVRDILDLRNEIINEVDDYTAKRTEKWQESEQAQNYEDFKSRWEEDADLEEIEIPDSATVDALDNLPNDV